MDFLQRQAALKCFCAFVPLARRSHGMMATRERGRPARTKPGTASAIFPACIHWQRRRASPSACPMPIPPTGWLPAASHRSVGKTISWDDGHPGARASRPHKAWHSFGHLPRLHPLATAPCLSFGLPNADTADRVASCSIAPKRSGGQRGRMRAGRPRSQAMSARSIESCHGRQAPLNALIREIPWLRHKITLFENATLARIGAV